MATTSTRGAVLVLCSDAALRESLTDLFVSAGQAVSVDPAPRGSSRPAAVVAACDHWPAGWNLARLRATFRPVPCLVLSGSPLAGDFVVTGFPRGYFVQLPAQADEILGLVTELTAA